MDIRKLRFVGETILNPVQDIYDPASEALWMYTKAWNDMANCFAWMLCSIKSYYQRVEVVTPVVIASLLSLAVLSEVDSVISVISFH